MSRGQNRALLARRRRFVVAAVWAAVVVLALTALGACGSTCPDWANDNAGVCMPNDLQAAMACETEDGCQGLGHRLASLVNFNLREILIEATRDIRTSQPIDATVACSGSGSAHVAGALQVLTSASWTVVATVTPSDCVYKSPSSGELTLSGGSVDANRFINADGDYTETGCFEGTLHLKAAISGKDYHLVEFDRDIDEAACAISMMESQQGVVAEIDIAGHVCEWNAAEFSPQTEPSTGSVCTAR